MNKSEYAKLYEVEKYYWWHQGRLKLIESQFLGLSKTGPLKILNVGGGTGGTVPTLEQFGEVENLDISDDAIKFMNQNGYRASKYDGKKLPFSDNNFDVVCAFDVLEHIKEDDKALKEWARVLKPQGHILITVPAYQWLWSKHDESMHHFRRYSRTKLSKLVESVNSLSKEKISYGFMFSFPLVVINRFTEKIFKNNQKPEAKFPKLPKPVNKLFIMILVLESRIMRYVSLPWGTSVVAVLKKGS